MKRKQLESLLTALLPVLRHFVERQIATATINLRSVLDASIAALPKPKDGADGKSVTIDEIKPLVAETIAAQIPKAADVAAVVLEGIELPAVPTVDDVVAKLQPSLPTAEQVAELARAKLTVPTAQEVAALVPSPKAEEIAALVKSPTIDEIVEAVISKVTVPTAEEVAKLIPAPIAPTAEEVAKLVPVPEAPTAEAVAALVKAPAVPTVDELVEAVLLVAKIPTAKEIAAEVPVPTVELPDAPTREEVTEIVKSLVPSATSIADEVRSAIHVPTPEEVALLVKVPELPELPQLPEIPSAEEIAKLVVPMVPEPPAVAEIVEALKHHIPAPIKGDKGDDAKPVDMEALATMLEGFFSKRWLEFERRANDALTKFIESIEKPKDGVDGLGFEDMQLDYDGERHLTIRFERGDKPTKSFSFDLPIVIYRGVWKAGEYQRGDSVTWDGCTWIAKANTTEKPGQSDSWQLSVKKGRDGRDGDDPDKQSPPRVRIPPRKNSGG